MNMTRNYTDELLADIEAKVTPNFATAQGASAQNEELRKQNAELLAALDEITWRFERICEDESGKIDPADKRRIAQARSVIARAKGTQ